jgi:type II secretory pathway pseudopilin PulG
MQAPGLAALKRWRWGTRRDRGAVLLEVLLALGLFVFAAAVVSSGLNAAVDRTLRLRAQTHALDLAVSVLSEIELGLRPGVAGGPEPFEPPFEQWTWELEAVPQSFGTDDLSGLQQVTVIVRGGEPPAVQRLATIVSVGGGPADLGASGEGEVP